MPNRFFVCMYHQEYCSRQSNKIGNKCLQKRSDCITNNRPWQGKWTALKGKNKGRYDVNVAET
ncbi:MAG: hypothetical protein LBC19_03095, partial [Tannerella sp.]|nr:hypothetical protein [Tannerella sp.]